MIPLLRSDRFNRYIEVFSWLMVLVSFLTINLLPLDVFADNHTILHFIIALTGVQILVYYRILPGQIRSHYLVSFGSQMVFATLIFLGVHFSGFLTSFFFPLLYVPIMVAAFTLSPVMLVVLVLYTSSLVLVDIYLYAPQFLEDFELLLMVGQRVGSVLVVGLLSFLMDYEVRKRESEIMATNSERDYAANLALEMDFLNKQSRAILDSISEAVLGLNSVGKIIFYNNYAEKLLGWKELEVVHKSYSNFLLIYPSGESYQINKPKERFEKEVKIFNKDGQSLNVKIINSPILDDKNAFLGNVLTVRDINKEKELEEMKFDFVSMAAHELRSPVTIIRGYLTAIDEETSSKDEKVKKFVRRARVTTDSLRVLVENLLNISQIERGSLKISQEEVIWEDIISKIVDDFSSRADEKAIKLTFIRPSRKLPTVSVDVFRISEVVANLLSNAINYTDTGGTITVELDVKNNFVVTEVKDSGIGIAEKSIPYLFQKFYRVSENLETGRGGTGLGLYISKTIVLRHGGRIWVTSKVGQGSSFYFTVPIAERESVKK